MESKYWDPLISVVQWRTWKWYLGVKFMIDNYVYVNKFVFDVQANYF